MALLIVVSIINKLFQSRQNS